MEVYYRNGVENLYYDDGKPAHHFTFMKYDYDNGVLSNPHAALPPDYVWHDGHVNLSFIFPFFHTLIYPPTSDVFETPIILNFSFLGDSSFTRSSAGQIGAYLGKETIYYDFSDFIVSASSVRCTLYKYELIEFIMYRHYYGDDDSSSDNPDYYAGVTCYMKHRNLKHFTNCCITACCDPQNYVLKG